MILLRRTVSANVCASVLLLLLGHICAGQSSSPPAVPPDAAPAQSAVSPKSTATPDPAKPATATSDVPNEAAAAKETAPKEPPKPAPAGSKAYVIGSLDELEIRVFSVPNLNGFYTVSEDGTISVPLIGDIRADGLTKEQLARVIADKLSASVLNNPPALEEINIQVVRNNSKKYYVLGGVARPGRFELNGEITVLDALALCLPFHDFAQKNKIFIVRRNPKDPTQPQTLKFNYNEVSKGKKMGQNIVLQDGDRIVVPES